MSSTQSVQSLTVSAATNGATADATCVGNSFSSFMYFGVEIQTPSGSIFAHAFPAEAGNTFSGVAPEVGSRVFSQTFTESDLKLFLAALKRFKFGLRDFLSFFCLPPPLTEDRQLEAFEICSFLQTLYWSSFTMENGVLVGVMRFTEDSKFEKKVYITDRPSKQEALDTFIFFRDTKTQICHTILANKKKTPWFIIHFTDDTMISVLDTGLYGTAIVGEHLNPDEKKGMTSQLAAYKQHVAETGQRYMLLDPKTISAPIRSALEELGYKLPSSFTPYMCGVDNMHGRDARYVRFGENNEFGVDRESTSVMIVFIGDCDIPQLGNPEDTFECSKGTVCTLEHARREFKVGGSMEPAFVSHPRMLNDVVTILDSVL